MHPAGGGVQCTSIKHLSVLHGVQVVPPVKTADFKLTVSTNREAVQMADLFADMLMQVWRVCPVSTPCPDCCHTICWGPNLGP